MSIQAELAERVAKILRDQWKTREGYKVPQAEDLSLENDAVLLEGAVLYADIDASTTLVDNQKAHFAAEVYKCFLHCAARIIKDEAGEVTAYDGDRVMAVYIGQDACDRAARTGLKINNARLEVINPAISRQYPDRNFQLQHVVGIDTCPLFITRTGVRGANDLVWVGRAANHAAKLCALPSEHPTWITAEVFNKLTTNCRIGSGGISMWEARTWTGMNRTVYRSSWMWTC